MSHLKLFTTESAVMFSYRLINASTLTTFRQAISHESWDDVLSETDPEIAYDTFLEKITSIYDARFPQKNI